jgi:hypothetical protein
MKLWILEFHLTHDLYLTVTDISGHSSTTKDEIVNPCIPYDTRHVPHSDRHFWTFFHNLRWDCVSLYSIWHTTCTSQWQTFLVILPQLKMRLCIIVFHLTHGLYLTMTDISGHFSTTKDETVYHCIPSDTRPIPHSDRHFWSFFHN